MNWIVSLRRYAGLAFLLFLSFVLGGLVYGGIGSSDRVKESSLPANQVGTVLGNAEEIAEDPVRKLKEIESEELSPDRAQKAIEYKMSFDPQLYDDYYNDFFLNQKIISVKNIRTDKEDYVFTGEDRTGDPHWLNNEYIFFTSYCGTSCQGLYLVNVDDKESELAVISYYFRNDGPWMTHFKDWFGEDYDFKGLVDEISSVMIEDKFYLVFKMKDGKGGQLDEKHFLFTEESLEEL